MSLSKENISQTLVTFVRSNILAPDVAFDGNSNLSKTGVDSYSVIEIILFIERQFGVVIPDTMLIPANLSSIDAMSECVFQLLNTK
jgi:acyl carrier protein